MKSKVALILAVLMILSFGLMVGCSQQADAGESEAEASQPAEETASETVSDAEETLTFGFGLWFRRDQWWKDLEAEALETAGELNIELSVQDGDGDSAKQVQQFETWIAQSVDAIIYAPVDASATTSLVAKATEKGIPVICLETSLEDMSNVMSYFEFDQYQAGYNMGVLAAEYLNENFDGAGKVVGVYDTTNVTVQIPRWNGFKAAIEELCPDAEIVGDHDGKNDRSVAMTVADNVLAADKDIQVWYTGMSDMGYGVAASMEAKGLDAANYFIATEGWGQETADHLRAENNYLKVACIPFGTDAARAAIEAVEAYIRDGVALEESTKVEIAIVTADNLDEYAAGMGAE